MRMIHFLAPAIASLAISLSGCASLEPANAPTSKGVYHINDSAQARVAMNNIKNHKVAEPGAEIVVVTHGKGIDFLLDDASDSKGEPYGPQVASTHALGVEFRVCRNTLKSRNLSDDAVSLDATVVPSGVAEIGKLQAKEGFVYIKP